MGGSLLYSPQFLLSSLNNPCNSVPLPQVKIPKPTSNQITRKEEAEMRAWARMHGKSVRQRNVRQDNTMDRVGSLPLNLYEHESVLKPLDLNEV